MFANSPCTATNTWSVADAGTGPSARTFATLTLTNTGNFVLFGGLAAGNYQSDVWEYSRMFPAEFSFGTRFNNLLIAVVGGSSWALQSSINGPPARAGHTVVADGPFSILVFGGVVSSGYFNDVYYFTVDSSWTLVNRGTTDVPSPRAYHSAVAVNGGMVIFGGLVDRPLLLFKMMLGFSNPVCVLFLSLS
jgi:hypothetical protein